MNSVVIRRRGEPVGFLALVEHELEAGDADDEQAEADVIDLDARRASRAFSQGGSSTRRLVRNSESRPTGRLMKKIQCQLKLSVIQPPSVGPMAGATTTAMP